MSPVNSIIPLHGMQTLSVFDIPPPGAELKKESLADSVNPGNIESPDKNLTSVHTVLHSCPQYFRPENYLYKIESPVWWYELREYVHSPVPTRLQPASDLPIHGQVQNYGHTLPHVATVDHRDLSAHQSFFRIGTKQRLWRYCRLGVVERNSAGKPLAYTRLDRSGRGPLKAVSHPCYISALRTKEPNEVSRFYEASLRRTGNPLHAQLNTQRKVLVVLWTIWKNNVSYQPNLFSPPPTSAGIAQTMVNP